MQDDMITVGSIIRAARDAIGMTQAGLGDAVGVSERTVIDWENDHRLPTFENLQILIQVLHIPAHQILMTEQAKYSPGLEQLMMAVSSCDEREQALFGEIGWAYIKALKDKTRADNL